MKENTLAKILAVACGLVAVTAMAQTSTTVTTTKDAATGTAVTESSTTTAAGTITTYTPGSDYLMLRAGTTGTPARYYYNRETTVLDPEGRTVTWSAVRPDVPATVYYVREGDRMIVRKVVLSKPTVVEKETTTTTTTTTQKP
ncbi:MAG TPA: hypothetical protein VNX27_00795 [Chthoniobacterales bacterium]|jgi:hypothetical protein|nr:hypothetical protein [Chthoniobacterales bacterium]